MFTGKPIVKDTDTAGGGRQGHGLPLALDGAQPGGRARHVRHGRRGEGWHGETDAFGRELSLSQALFNSVGIKLGSYPPDVLQRNLRIEASKNLSEIRGNEAQARSAAQRGDLNERAATQARRRAGEAPAGAGRLPQEGGWRASACHAGGRGFESRPLRQNQ
jgi:hypothetical protein